MAKIRHLSEGVEYLCQFVLTEAGQVRHPKRDRGPDQRNTRTVRRKRPVNGKSPNLCL